MNNVTNKILHAGSCLCAVAQSLDTRPLRILKFGGTSVGDGASILQVVEIVAGAFAGGDTVVVVSAMCGVTNKLIEAGKQAAAGEMWKASSLLQEVHTQHDIASLHLLTDEDARKRYLSTKDGLLNDCRNWCEEATRLAALSPALQDLIASLGERLSAPLVAAALVANGMQATAIEATRLVTTDNHYGSATPDMDATRENCEAQLRPLLKSGTIPVVTGFIGVAADGSLTTLGRGGSDYSATILAAALQAQEVTIWTDVDGIFTADPHEVPSATTIPELSYQEASDLAYFGARVLHPKTLRPVFETNIPVWIRNTFASGNVGTKITKRGPVTDGGVSALSVIRDAALITLTRSREASVPDVFEMILRTAANIYSELLMVSYLSQRDKFCVVVAAGAAHSTAEALRRELAKRLNRADENSVVVEDSVSVLTVVGQNLVDVKGIVKRALSALGSENIDVLATGQASSECSLSLVVSRKDIRTATLVTHHELKRDHQIYNSSTELLHQNLDTTLRIPEFNS